MKKVEAIIRHYKLDEIKAGLNELGLHGMTVSECRGFGRQRGHKETYRGAEYTVDFLPKLLVEIACRDDQWESVVDVILTGCRTGQVGDGKIFVHELSEVVRIRTGEVGEDAI